MPVLKKRIITLQKVKEDILSCKKCPLFKTRENPVPGEGDMNAKVMLVGEAPGFNEDRTGHPFCGAAGKILDELLLSIGVKREKVYIANILKCRPPNNRKPQKKEIDICTSYLDKQIEIIKPKVICPLGNYSTSYIFEKYGLKEEIQGISKIHGKIFDPVNLKSSVKIIPLYHPAVATYNANMKGVLTNDFSILEKFI